MTYLENIGANVDRITNGISPIMAVYPIGENQDTYVGLIAAATTPYILNRIPGKIEMFGGEWYESVINYVKVGQSEAVGSIDDSPNGKDFRVYAQGDLRLSSGAPYQAGDVWGDPDNRINRAEVVLTHNPNWNGSNPSDPSAVFSQDDCALAFGNLNGVTYTSVYESKTTHTNGFAYYLSGYKSIDIDTECPTQIHWSRVETSSVDAFTVLVTPTPSWPGIGTAVVSFEVTSSGGTVCTVAKEVLCKRTLSGDAYVTSYVTSATLYALGAGSTTFTFSVTGESVRCAIVPPNANPTTWTIRAKFKEVTHGTGT